jgi:hypothetical protein
LRPEKKEEGGWSYACVGVLQVRDTTLDLLQVKVNWGNEEERQRKKKKIGGRRRRGFTRWRWNQPVMLADVRGSNEKFQRLEMVSARERKRGEGGGPGLLIGSSSLRRGLGFSSRARRWTAREKSMRERESCTGGGG